MIVKSDRSETENLDQNYLNVEQNSEIETVKPSLEAENISIIESSSHLINISGLNPEVSINQNMNSRTKRMKTAIFFWV